MKQKELTKKNIIDRVYIDHSAYDWKTGKIGKAIIFEKPYTEKPFYKQKVIRVMNLQEYKEEFGK